MPDPLKIEVGDTVNVLAFPESTPILAVVLALPSPPSAYWRLKTIPNDFIMYASESAVPLLQLVNKGP